MTSPKISSLKSNIAFKYQRTLTGIWLQCVLFLDINITDIRTNQFNITVLTLVSFSICYMFQSMFGSLSGSFLITCLLLNCPNMDLYKYHFKHPLISISFFVYISIACSVYEDCPILIQSKCRIFNIIIFLLILLNFDRVNAKTETRDFCFII
jgi:hypothetical protein